MLSTTADARAQQQSPAGDVSRPVESNTAHSAHTCKPETTRHIQQQRAGHRYDTHDSHARTALHPSPLLTPTCSFVSHFVGPLPLENTGSGASISFFHLPPFKAPRPLLPYNESQTISDTINLHTLHLHIFCYIPLPHDASCMCGCGSPTYHRGHQGCR